MRRHPPRFIKLTGAEKTFLKQLVRDGRTEQRAARRARILLAMTKARTVVGALAERLEVTPQAIWDLCRRYEERGLEAVWDAPRSGRPRSFSPLGSSANRTVGLL
jgi:predicted ArsR family transcriptional regulator